jgi:hypothetical protein
LHRGSIVVVDRMALEESSNGAYGGADRGAQDDHVSAGKGS